MFRFKLLSHTLFTIAGDAFELAVGRWMVELENWIAIVFGEQDDRETRNHNPWGDGGGFDANAFGAGAGDE